MHEVYWSSGREVGDMGQQTNKGRKFTSRRAARRFAHGKRMELKLPIPDYKDHKYIGINRLVRIDPDGVEWDKYVAHWW